MAPVEEGTPVGTLRVWIGDTMSQETPLYAAETVELGSLHQRALDAVSELLVGRLASDGKRLSRRAWTFSSRPCTKTVAAACMLPKMDLDWRADFSSPSKAGKGRASRRRSSGWPERLRAKRYDIVVTREPGGSPGAEAVRHVLLSGAAEPFGPKMEALLFAAARSDHVEQVIRPAVERGKIVLCDRFLDSSRVYQGVTGDLDPAFMAALETRRDQRHDARHDADLRHRSGRRTAARASARRGTDAAPTASRRKRLPSTSAAAKAFLAIAASRTRALHRHRRVRRPRRGGECRHRRPCSPRSRAHDADAPGSWRREA